MSNLTLPQFNRTQAKLWCWVEWNGTKQRVGMAEIRAGCKSAAAMGHPHVHACTSQRRNLARERFSHLLPETPVCPRRSCWGASSSWGRWLMEAVSGLCPATSRRAGAQQAVGQGRFGERWRGSGALCRQARSGLRLLCSWDGRFAQALHRPVSPRPACEALQPQLHPEPQRLRADVPVGAGSRQPPPHQRRAEVCRVSLGGCHGPQCLAPGHLSWPSPPSKPHGKPRPLPDGPPSPLLSLPQKQSPGGDRLHPARRPQPLHGAAPAAPALPANGDLGVCHQRPGHG